MGLKPPLQLNEELHKALQECWPDRWEQIYQKHKDSDLLFQAQSEHIKKKCPSPEERLWIKIRTHKSIKAFEQQVSKEIIPKEKLEDNVWYLAMKDTHKLCRHVERARWDEKEQMFWYSRTKFGQTFEDTMHHFSDVIDAGIAGFTPIKKENENN